MNPTSTPAATSSKMTLAHYTAPIAFAAAKTIEAAIASAQVPVQVAAKPRPKKSGPIHRIIQGDCLEMMAKIPDRSIDFICSDFPYNISGKGGLTMKGNTITAADF